MPGGIDASAIQLGTGVDSMYVVRNGDKVVPVPGDRFEAPANN
ncbi:hypothetical protein [Sporosarcina sp. OR05]